MAYKRKVGQDHPGLLLFLLDLSASMAYKWPGNAGGIDVTKSQFQANVLNQIVAEVGANSLASGTIKHRVDVGLIGYEGGRVYSLFGGDLTGRDIVGIDEVIQHPLGTITRKEQRGDPVEGTVEVERKVDYWIEPTTGGCTPMGQGLAYGRDLVEQWLSDPRHQDSFPPMIIHQTDGEPDGSERQLALDEAEAIKRLSTSDGNALVITVHIPTGFGQTILFPVSKADLPAGDDAADLLFTMSSTMPDELAETAIAAGLPVQPGSKLMVMNADAMIASRLMTWGSSAGGAITP